MCTYATEFPVVLKVPLHFTEKKKFRKKPNNLSLFLLSL